MRSIFWRTVVWVRRRRFRRRSESFISRSGGIVDLPERVNRLLADAQDVREEAEEAARPL